jgi:hypothetical protein
MKNTHESFSGYTVLEGRDDPVDREGTAPPACTILRFSGDPVRVWL